MAMKRSKKQEEHARKDEPIAYVLRDSKGEAVTVYSGSHSVQEIRARGPLPPDAPAQKHDGGKLPWHLLPYDAVREVVRVLAFGASKYAVRNWEKGLPHSRTFAATMRHLTAHFQDGETHDAETGISHLAHAACEILFALAFEVRGRKELDDRPSTAVTP